MAKSHAPKVKAAPSTVVAQRVMAHHEQGGMSQGELRRNYLSGNQGDGFKIGRVAEGICRKGEWFGSGPSDATRDTRNRPIVGRPTLPPISPDDPLTYGEGDGHLFRTREGKIIRTTHMGDKPLPRPKAAPRRPAPTTVISDGSDRAAALLREKGWPINARNLAHARDYIAAKDAGIVRF